MKREEYDIKFVCIGGPYGDACCSYEVKGVEGMDLTKFINHILSKNPNEWGYFETPNKRYEYRYGKLLGAEIKDVPSGINISKVTANGGWSRMDYKINY